MRRDCLTPCMALENYNQSISMTLKITVKKTCAFIRSLNCLRGIGQIVNSTDHTQSNPEKAAGDNPLRLIALRTSDLGVGVFGVHPSTNTAPASKAWPDLATHQTEPTRAFFGIFLEMEKSGIGSSFVPDPLTHASRPLTILFLEPAGAHPETEKSRAPGRASRCQGYVDPRSSRSLPLRFFRFQPGRRTSPLLGPASSEASGR